MIHRTRSIQATAVVVALLLLAASSLPSVPPSVRGQTLDLFGGAPEAGPAQVQTGDAPEGDVPPGLTAADWATMQELIRQARFQFTWQESDGVWAYRAPNPAHGLSLSLASDGLHAARKGSEGGPPWEFSLSLAAYGGQTFPTAVAEGGLTGSLLRATRGSPQRVEYHWSPDVVEWFVNSDQGLEHGVTLAAPPAGTEGPTVELTFAVRGSLTPELDGSGRGLQLVDAGGHTALLYDQLAVYDAAGRSLPARFSLSAAASQSEEPGSVGPQTLHLAINTSNAAYPLIVDPLLHRQVTKLAASDAQPSDNFGVSVASCGDTVVIGAHFEDGGNGDPVFNAGAAYVFTRNQGGADGWGEIQKLTAPDAQDSAVFGHSVAISGDTIVVGAYLEDGGSTDTIEDAGAAHIFARNQGGPDNWGYVTTLTASTPDNGDWFGRSVAISGDTVVVGAHVKDSTHSAQGTAYVFERNQGGADNWGQVQMLTAIDAGPNDYFGASVAISVDTLVVGAYGEDGGSGDPLGNAGAAYVFERNQGSPDAWGQVQKLSASDPQVMDYFGSSVAISGDTVVVGAKFEDGGNGDPVTSAGAAYLFARNQGGTDMWGQVQKLTASDAWDDDYFGSSVAISGDTVVVGAFGQDAAASGGGAAYVFERNQGGLDDWGQVQKLTASDPGLSDNFGGSVAISGDSVLVGSSGADSGRGAAYLFVASGQWEEVAVPNRSGAQDDDYFGGSVAISGDTAVIGVEGEDGLGSNRGAAYVFERNHGGADGWGQVTKLSASDAQDSDYFGGTVSISGDTVIVGASGEDGGGTNRGAAYVFARNQGGADTWGQVQKLSASDPGNSDLFGYSVAISGDTAVVGAENEDGTGSDRGAAYVFERNHGGVDNWGQVMKLMASDAADSDYFGRSVAISGDTVVVGADAEDGDGTDRGAAYLFARNQGGADNWGQVQKLAALDTADSNYFGWSVAISGDTAAVGAFGEDGGGSDRGAAYVFERNQGGLDQWGQVAKLTASDAQNGDNLGRSVGISVDTVVAGAYGEDGTGSNRGAAYVFERNQGGADNWGQVTKLMASDAENSDFFGNSVAISDDAIVVGAYQEDGDGSNRGAAYVFARLPYDQVYLPLVIKSAP